MKTNKGFTLIELLVVMLVGLVILGGLVTFFTSQNRAYASHSQQVDTLQEARLIVEIMTTDLRLAGYKGTGYALSGINQATDKSIRVLADLDRNGSTSGTNEDITIAYDPNTATLTRTMNGNAEVLSDSIQGFSLLYTMFDGTTTAAPSVLGDIRKVTVNLSVKSKFPDAMTKTYKIVNLVSDITPRNLAY
ncbi:MAG TPA: prepilin-type N-terminal cleavage/methylation domain-containing protein [Thermodesulfobacteriota bacterium]|nr:prepilin-type N-terminal cleavage/methylation domain-containing protein [Thermodesulfobacteriota bacterium]